MQSAKMYTGDDGQSHFEDLDFPFDPAQEVHRTDIQAAPGIQFVYQPLAWSLTSWTRTSSHTRINFAGRLPI